MLGVGLKCIAKLSVLLKCLEIVLAQAVHTETQAHVCPACTAVLRRSVAIDYKHWAIIRGPFNVCWPQVPPILSKLCLQEFNHIQWCEISRESLLDTVQVFWIIVGTGSVNVISFNTLPDATSLPPSTAVSTPSQYGRRMLLQASQPAENVVFAVTLPSASQNSLLVLQSSSDTVRQQFAGWFVTQMAARGKQLWDPVILDHRQLSYTLWKGRSIIGNI